MPDFQLDDFLPYLLNNAAEVTSRAFSAHYREAYGMSRAQWRIMAHLGRGTPMTASDICINGHLEKSKVSRAVSGLEEMGLLERAPSSTDRRAEILTLTQAGLRIYADLSARATQFQNDLTARLGPQQMQALTGLLREMAKP